MGIMTSRYGGTWKFAKDGKGEMGRAIRLRPVLRGFMDVNTADVGALQVQPGGRVTDCSHARP
eukprot:9271098-Pyramimonas_sp.AAC.1